MNSKVTRRRGRRELYQPSRREVGAKKKNWKRRIPRAPLGAQREYWRWGSVQWGGSQFRVTTGTDSTSYRTNVVKWGMNFPPKDAADTCKADLGVTWEEVANRFNGRLRNVSGNCVTWCVFSPIPCATVPWPTLITKVRGALVKGTGTHTAKFVRLRCCCEFTLRSMEQGCPVNKISRRVSGPGGSFRCWQAGCCYIW